MNNIILIGMPGCGKSTLGVILAKTLGYDFVDTDLIIQKNERKRLCDIINEEGIDQFIECETKAILSLDCKYTVIATGGSVVLSEIAMLYLKSLGKVVYIRHSVETIEKRLDNINTRGVVMTKDEGIRDIYMQRTPLYEKYADIIIEPENDNIERTIERLIGNKKLIG